MNPERIGRFTVERLLGSGTFATVWLAHDTDLNAPVAIKVLAENWSQAEDAQRRFLDEARALRELDSDRIVRVYEFGRLDDGRPYMVTEFADRGNLQERMTERFASGGRFAVAETAALSAEIAQCLVDAHDRNIVHRDLKPSNVMFRSIPTERQEAMRREGRPVTGERMLLGDFGIARRLEASGRTMVVGTPHYMAPEQADPETASAADGRADVYAAAVVAFELLAGRVPFPHESVGRVQRAQLEEDPPDVSTLRDGVPAAFADVIRKGLARSPADRYATAREWRDALRAAASGEQPAAAVPGQATVIGSAGEPPAGGGSGSGGSGGSGGGGGGGSAAPMPPSKRRASRAVAIVVVLALAVAGGVAFGLQRAEADTVTLVPATVTGPSAFFDPDVPQPGATEATQSTAPSQPSAPATPLPLPTELAKVGSTLVGLYGGTGLNTQCDRNKLISFLATHLDKARAWAATMGVGVDQIGDFIRSELVPVILKIDARVTNHGFVGGVAKPFQSILQAGSAVLVDLFGRPRVRCKCGNPLLPPVTKHKKVKLVGQRWPGFSVTTVININIAAPPVPQTTIYDSFSTSPSPTAAPPPKPKVVDVTASIASISASSTYSSEFSASNAHDGDTSTSWFSAGAHAGPGVLTITLKRAFTVTRVDFYGNEHNATPAFRHNEGFPAWTIDLLSASGALLYRVHSSGGGDVSQKHLVPSVRGVVRLRFTGIGHQDPNCGGFSELHAMGYAA